MDEEVTPESCDAILIGRPLLSEFLWSGACILLHAVTGNLIRKTFFLARQ